MPRRKNTWGALTRMSVAGPNSSRNLSSYARSRSLSPLFVQPLVQHAVIDPADVGAEHGPSGDHDRWRRHGQLQPHIARHQVHTSLLAGADLARLRRRDGHVDPAAGAIQLASRAEGSAPKGPWSGPVEDQSAQVPERDGADAAGPDVAEQLVLTPPTEQHESVTVELDDRLRQGPAMSAVPAVDRRVRQVRPEDLTQRATRRVAVQSRDGCADGRRVG